MSSIVIALPKIEDAKKIRAILERHGFSVASVCSAASNALASASELESGVLICGYRLPDMNYLDLSDCLPGGFEMLLLASERVICEVPDSILSLQMPLKTKRENDSDAEKPSQRGGGVPLYPEKQHGLRDEYGGNSPDDPDAVF